MKKETRVAIFILDESARKNQIQIEMRRFCKSKNKWLLLGKEGHINVGLEASFNSAHDRFD